jgi:ribulose 1,5-bisphosphate carboxylase large subunit-like protein
MAYHWAKGTRPMPTEARRALEAAVAALQLAEVASAPPETDDATDTEDAW